MSYYLKTIKPENAEGQLKRTYDMLQEMFQTVPKHKTGPVRADSNVCQKTDD